MSRRSLLLITLIAGCAFDPPAEGDEVPTGGDDGPAMVGDRDGDGVLDDVDNCPDVANPPEQTLGFAAPVQRDHDGDGRGDACDLCPHIAWDAPDGDRDGDAIGDACDPEPDIANPAPYWNGFYDPPDAQWSARSGSLGDWEVVRRDDGRIGWRERILDGTTRHQILLTGRRQEHWVQTAILPEQIETTASNTLRSATVTFGFEVLTSFDAYYSCGVRQNTSSQASDVVVALQHNETNTSDLTATSWPTVVVGQTINVTARGTRTGSSLPDQGGTALGCDGADGATARTASDSSSQRPDGQVGLRTFGMTAWFDYIFVVEPRPR